MGLLYLYAIADRPDLPLPGDPGLEEAPLRRLVYRDITAIVSPLADGPPAPTAANVWRHEHVIESLMAGRAVLPARFGMLLKAPRIALDDLVERYDAYAGNLDRVRGRVELGLRVLWEPEAGAPAPPGQPSDGRGYLMARLAEERRAQAARRAAEAQVAELSGDLAALASDRVEEVLATPKLLLKAAYLVERDRIAAFQRAVGQQQASRPGMRFLCTGPWPAYHFVTVG